MKEYKEMKKIAEYVLEVDKLVGRLQKKIFDFTDGIDWWSAKIVTLSKKDIKEFERTNGVTDDYYVEQWTGYCEDDYHGYLYFKTDIENKYVKIRFDC